MTGDTILKTLSGVRSRLWRMRAVRGASWGLIAAAVTGGVLGIARLAGWIAVSPLIAGALTAVGPIFGAISGLVRRPRWEIAASAVDSHYRLKDRAATALAFLHRPAAGAWESLAVEDAARHLSGVKAEQVVPFRWPRPLSYGLAAIAVAAVLLVWPTAGPVQAAPVGPNDGLIAIADELEKDLDELEKAAEEKQDEELKEVIKELRERTEALREEDVELKEALATLSEMQAALQQHAQYNEALVDAQLSNLAGAMAAAEALQPTAEELEAGDHKEAAEELAKLEKLEPGRRGEKAAAERMRKLADEMKGKGLGALGGSVSEMAEGLSGGNSDKFCQGCRSLASQLKKHDARKQMTSLLCRQLDKLNECKGQCSMCFGNGQCEGNGQCNSQKNSLAEGLKPKKSNSPSNNWGKSTSGNLFGEKTDLASTGKQEQLTGQAGEGPSDVETTTSPEGREQAGRAYKERYEKYRKLSEEVLDGEPIPLGHRQTIRTYFELIRPTGAETAAEVETESTSE